MNQNENNNLSRRAFTSSPLLVQLAAQLVLVRQSIYLQKQTLNYQKQKS